MNFENPNPNDTDTPFGAPSPEVMEAIAAARRGDALKKLNQRQPELYADGGVVRLRIKDN